MKKMNQIVFVFITAMSLFGCKNQLELPSPIIAEFEILDSENNLIKDAVFTATLDGQELADFSYSARDLSKDVIVEDFTRDGHFVNGSYTYVVSSNTFSKLTPSPATEENMNALFSGFSIKVSKDGYKTKEVVPSANQGHCCYMSVVLEKE